MIYIEGTDYGIESDDMNVILMKKYYKREKVEGKWIETDEFDYKAHAFYPTLKRLLRGLVRKEIKSTKFKDIETIQNKIDDLYKYIDKVVKEME